MRLIDADELKIDYGFTWDDITPTHDEMYALIDRQPTIEPERNTGKWIEIPDEVFASTYKCSSCGEAPLCDGYSDYAFSPYCPHCGCKMEG